MSPQADPVLKSRNDLQQALENLRPLLREITKAVTVQTEAEITALSEAIRNLPNPEPDSKAASRQEKIMGAMQALLAGLKVKPEKGRLKDLRRLRDLLKELAPLAQQLSR
ncbi:MAG: hypothetical protein ONA90_10400 [candidate division KSB1 bacterium]|nr:hypothetical protein [candidate division KSB1 bacterium]